MVFNLFFVRRRGAQRKKPRKSPRICFDNKEYLDNKEKARSLVTARLEYFNQFYGFKWNRVSIKNTKRRWGSCSKKGNLNFCYRVVFLPQDSADYIVAHELCHLGQFDHSKEFWGLVARLIPDYKVARKSLKNVKIS